MKTGLAVLVCLVCGLLPARAQLVTNMIVSNVYSARAYRALAVGSNQVATVLSEGLTGVSCQCLERVERINGVNITNSAITTYMGWRVFGPATAEVVIPVTAYNSGSIIARVTME